MINKTLTFPCLNIFPIGMDARAQQTLRVFFENHLEDRCSFSEEHEADVVLVDLDAYKAKAMLDAQCGRHPQRPLIVLSLNDAPPDIPNSLFIKKPIRIDAFSKALHDMSIRLLATRKSRMSLAFGSTPAQDAGLPEKLSPAAESIKINDLAAGHLQSRESHFYVGSMPDADLDSITERTKVFYSPKEFLQGHFQRALDLGYQQASVVRLSGPGFGNIDIYPFARKIISRAQPSILQASGRLPLRTCDITIEMLEKAPHFPPENEKTESFDLFRWKLALWASRGRVPMDTDLDMPVFLKSWPNLTRLLDLPNAIRIAGLWARQPATLAQTASILAIPQRYVFAFYSACAELGLAGITERSAETLLIIDTPKEHEKRGLFGMLLGKLMRKREA